MTSISDSLGSLAKSAGVMMVGSIIGRAFGLIGEVVIARELNPELFGEISLAYTVLVTAGNVLLLGVHEGVTRLSSAENDARARWEIIQAGVLTASVSGFGGLLAIVALGDRIANLMSLPGLERYLLILLPYLLLFPLSTVVIAVLRSQERTAVVVVTRSFVGRIIAIGLLLTGLWLGFGTTAAAIYWLAVPAVVVVLGGYLALGRMETPKLGLPSKRTVVRLWKFSWPVAMSSIVFMMLSNLDVLMIGYFLESGDVGNYRAIQPLQQAATFVMGSFTFLFLPLATKYYERGELEELNKLFTVSTKWTVLLTIPGIFVFTVAAEEVVNLLFGPDYRAAGLPLAVLSGGLFIRTLTGPNGEMVKAINQPKIEFYSGVVGVVSNIILNIVLIPRYGLVGAAAATVGGYGIYNVVELYVVYVKTGTTPFSFNIIKPIVVSVIAIWLVQNAVPVRSDVMRIIMVGTMGGIIVIVSFVATKSVEKEDVELLERVESRIGIDLNLAHQFLRFGTK